MVTLPNLLTSITVLLWRLGVTLCFFFQIFRSDFFLDRDFSQCIPVYRRFRPGCNDFYKYLLVGSGGFPGWNLKLYLLTAYKTKHSYPLSTVSFPA